MTCREFASNFLETVKAEPSEELLKVYSENVALLVSLTIIIDCSTLDALMFILLEKI